MFHSKMSFFAKILVIQRDFYLAFLVSNAKRCNKKKPEEFSSFLLFNPETTIQMSRENSSVNPKQTETCCSILISKKEQTVFLEISSHELRNVLFIHTIYTV